jgi:hypothetical protein
LASQPRYVVEEDDRQAIAHMGRTQSFLVLSPHPSIFILLQVFPFPVTQLRLGVVITWSVQHLPDFWKVISMNVSGMDGDV